MMLLLCNAVAALGGIVVGAAVTAMWDRTLQRSKRWRRG